MGFFNEIGFKSASARLNILLADRAAGKSVSDQEIERITTDVFNYSKSIQQERDLDLEQKRKEIAEKERQNRQHEQWHYELSQKKIYTQPETSSFDPIAFANAAIEENRRKYPLVFASPSALRVREIYEVYFKDFEKYYLQSLVEILPSIYFMKQQSINSENRSIEISVLACISKELIKLGMRVLGKNSSYNKQETRELWGKVRVFLDIDKNVGEIGQDVLSKELDNALRHDRLNFQTDLVELPQTIVYLDEFDKKYNTRHVELGKQVFYKFAQSCTGWDKDDIFDQTEYLRKYKEMLWPHEAKS